MIIRGELFWKMQPRIILILLLMATLIALLQCQKQWQKVAKFCPATRKINASPALIKRNESLLWEILTSWSVCLRFNVLKWSPNIRLFEIANFKLLLESISNRIGQVYYHGPVDQIFRFDLKDALSFSHKSWNSACMSYSTATEHLTVLINGQVLLNAALDMQFMPKYSNFSYAVAGYEGFVGSITDFNVWSRPLYLQDMEDFSRGNISLNENTPDIIIWQSALVNPRNGRCLNLYTMNPRTIELDNALLHPVEIFGFEPTFLGDTPTFAALQSQCKRINGQVFYPLNSEQLSWMMQTFGHMFDDLFGTKKIWVPFQKIFLANGLSEWWLSEGPKTRKAEFGPWALNTTQSDGECLHFDIFNEQYVQRKCDNHDSIGLLCQLERNRLIFKLESECLPEWKNQVDELYFLSDEMAVESLGQINLIGETALTNFVYAKDTKMLQRASSESSESHLFILVLVLMKRTINIRLLLNSTAVVLWLA